MSIPRLIASAIHIGLGIHPLLFSWKPILMVVAVLPSQFLIMESEKKVELSAAQRRLTLGALEFMLICNVYGAWQSGEVVAIWILVGPALFALYAIVFLVHKPQASPKGAEML